MDISVMNFALAILVAVIGAVVWLFNKFDKLKEKNHYLELQIKELEKRIEVQNSTLSEFKAYTDIFISLLKDQLNKRL